MQNDAGIELTAAGAHRQAVERREPHRCRDRNPVAHCAGRAAVAEMRHDYAAVGDFGSSLRQYRSDVFVGKTVKAVEPYALSIERVRQCERPLGLRSVAAKGGIAT